jgi:hypothetical protein
MQYNTTVEAYCKNQIENAEMLLSNVTVNVIMTMSSNINNLKDADSSLRNFNGYQ